MPRSNAQLKEFLSLRNQSKKPRGKRKKKEPVRVQVVSPRKGVVQIQNYAKQVGEVPRFSAESIESHVTLKMGQEVNSIFEAARSLPSSLDLDENLALHATVISDSASVADSEPENFPLVASIPDSDDQSLLQESSRVIYLECSEFYRPKYTEESDSGGSPHFEDLKHSRGCVAISDNESF